MKFCMRSIFFIILVIQLPISTLFAEMTFEKSRQYIKSIDRNATVKKELETYLDLTDSLIDDGDISDGLVYLRLRDCIATHNNKKMAEQFQMLILEDIKDSGKKNNFMKALKKTLWWPMTMGMKVEAGEITKEEATKFFECGNTSKVTANTSKSDIKKGLILSATIPKRTPSSAGQKTRIFENFVKISLKNPIEKLDNQLAITLGMIPKSMIKSGKIISSEGAEVSLSKYGKNGLRIDYKGISSKLEGRQSPCSSLIFLNGDIGPYIDKTFYPAPDTWIINGKQFSQASTKFDQIQKACELNNPADISIIMSDYTKDSSKTLQSSEGKIRKIKSLPMKFVDAVAHSNDGSITAFGTRDYIRIKKEDKTFKSLHYFSANNLFITKDNKWIIATRYRGEIGIFDIQSGRRLKQINGGHAIIGADLSPDENYLALASEKGEFRIIDLEQEKTLVLHTPKMAISRYHGHSRLRSVKYSPDGNTIVIGGEKDELVFYDVHSDTFTKTLNIDRAREIRALLFIDSNTLIAGGRYLFAKIDTKNYKVIPLDIEKENGYLNVKGLDISPDGRYLALTGSENIIYDMYKEKIIDRIGSKYGDVRKLLFLSNNRFVSISHKHEDAVVLWEFNSDIR